MIFLCYAKEDKGVVDGVYKALRGAGLDPWMDKPPIPYQHLGIKPGASWDLVIRENIEQADLIFAFLSKTSLAKRGYVQREYRLALNAMAQLPPDVVKFIPVLLEPCEPHALRVDAVSFADFQWFEMYEHGIEDLIRLAADQWGADPRDVILRGLMRDNFAAAELQRSTIRGLSDQVPGYQVAHWFDAAHVVAGDFMTIRRRLDGTVLIAHGDVAGKGVRAAMSAHAIMAVLASMVEHESGPREMIERLNRLGSDLVGHARFATMFIGTLHPESGRLDYVSAGQPFLVIDGRGAPQMMGATGIPIGMFPGMDYQQATTTLERGAVLALISDGIWEAPSKDGDELFGEERVIQLLQRGRYDPLDVVCERVKSAVHGFGSQAPVDDQALLVIRRVTSET